MSTVARAVPTGSPSAFSACVKHVVPPPRLAVALQLRQVVVGAGLPRRAAPARCGRGRGRNPPAAPGQACRPPGNGAPRRCSPRGRTRSTAVSASSRYDLPLTPGRCSRSAAGPRPSGCPGPRSRSPTSGLSESSKSAMNTCAPELSALMIILRSTGPVISTRRSSRSRGIGATFQSRRAHAGRLGQEVEPLGAGVEPGLADGPGRQQFLERGPEPPGQVLDERARLRRQDAVEIGGRSGGLQGHDAGSGERC